MRIQYQNPRDYVDLLLCSELTFGMYQDKRRREIIFMLILCCLIKKYSKNQDSLYRYASYLQPKYILVLVITQILLSIPLTNPDRKLFGFLPFHRN